MTTDTPKNIAKPLFSGRRVLWVGCAFIMAVMSFSTAEIIYSLRKTGARSDAVISAFRHRTHLLNALRGLMIRSARSPNSDGERAMDASELPAAHLQADQMLEEFGKSLEASGDEATQETLADLRNSINRYWDSLPDIREQNGKLPHSAPPSVGSPERKQIRHIARQIIALNTEQQDRAEAQLHAEQDHLQGELLVSSLLSVAVVFALIAAISYRIKRTERYAETQYLDVVQARTELRNFTARLENAQEEERRKLSRELHDEFGQTMAAALVELGRIQNEMVNDDGTRAQLARVKLELERSMRSIRDIALLLRPSMLDDLGLVPALRWQAREVARRSGLVVRIEADDKSEFLPDTYRTCIYRVVQEALHNTVKHASATSVVVVFKSTNDALVLAIEDNGKGFRPASEKGLGLLGIEERVGRLSGRVQVTSSPNNGAAIHVTLPVPTDEEGEMAG
ncbi:MAG TPA: sensor histidine kinase [Candidatus Polarisedimenticolia bacterium]|nr:sensor histidine kinase [Candidatus Polarisedimenticolia bacterium]